MYMGECGYTNAEGSVPLLVRLGPSRLRTDINPHKYWELNKRPTRDRLQAMPTSFQAMPANVRTARKKKKKHAS